MAVPHPAAGLGVLIDALTNNPMAIYEMGPGAAAIEYFVINWMLGETGKTPLAFVANACSTAVGIYDHIRPLGEFCRERGIWLHVDSAHGAAALLLPARRHLLDGVELADSLT
ncbi:MAG: pyridoxal-dependent decarboxylase [Thiohalocapsa sp.]